MTASQIILRLVESREKATFGFSTSFGMNEVDLIAGTADVYEVFMDDARLFLASKLEPYGAESVGMNMTKLPNAHWDTAGELGEYLSELYPNPDNCNFQSYFIKDLIDSGLARKLASNIQYTANHWGESFVAFGGRSNIPCYLLDVS